MASTERTASAEDVERLLREQIVSHRFGSTEIRDLIVAVGEDADAEVAIYAHLILADPSGPTWPIDDVWAIRSAVRQLLIDHPPDVPWYVTMRPEHDEEEEPGTT